MRNGIEFETTITEMSVETFERISEIRKQPEYDRIRYMVGVELVDGTKCAMHIINYIDCDIATGDMLGFIEWDNKIEVIRVKRKNILNRV